MNRNGLFASAILVILFVAEKCSATSTKEPEALKCVVRKVASDYQESVLVLAQTKLLLVMLAGKEIPSDEIWHRLNLKSPETLGSCSLEDVLELKSSLSQVAIEGWKLLVSDEFLRERTKFKKQVYRFAKKLVDVAQLLSKMAFQLGTSTFRMVNLQLLTETFENSLETIERKQILDEMANCTELPSVTSGTQPTSTIEDSEPTSTDLPTSTVDEEIHRLYPACRNETDLFANNRLTGFFKVLKNEPAEVLVEAYNALLRVILKSEYICTQDYVELARQVYKLAGNLTTPEDLEASTKLKNRFNPGVFKLFEADKKWIVASVNESGYAVFAVEEKPSTELKPQGQVLKKYGNSSETLEEAFKWRIFADEDYFMIRSVFGKNFAIGSSGDVSKLKIIPTTESVTDTGKEFQFQLVSYEGGHVSAISSDSAILSVLELGSIEKSIHGAQVYVLRIVSSE